MVVVNRDVRIKICLDLILPEICHWSATSRVTRIHQTDRDIGDSCLPLVIGNERCSRQRVGEREDVVVLFKTFCLAAAIPVLAESNSIEHLTPFEVCSPQVRLPVELLAFKTTLNMSIREQATRPTTAAHGTCGLYGVCSVAAQLVETVQCLKCIVRR